MRHKLSLNLEDLSVDSFDTTGAQTPRGTVLGEECTCPTQCTCPGCPTCATCPATCPFTCDGASCGESCDSCEYSNCDTCPYTCGTNSYCADCQG